MTAAPHENGKGEVELKPCPFCGWHEPAHNIPREYDAWKESINCPSCLVHMPRECGRDELIAMWNYRVHEHPDEDEAQP